MTFTFFKVYPRLTIRLEPVWLSFVKCVNCWLHAMVQSKAQGWLCAFGAASVTVTDRVPKSLWQVHSSIHSSSQTFDSLGNKIAVLPFDDKNQFTSHGTIRLLGLFTVSCDTYCIHVLCCITLCDYRNKSRQENMMTDVIGRYRKV